MTVRPPVTAEELAGRDAARRAPPMSDGRVEELLRLLRSAITTRNGGAYPATTSTSTLLATGCVTPGEVRPDPVGEAGNGRTTFPPSTQGDAGVMTMDAAGWE